MTTDDAALLSVLPLLFSSLYVEARPQFNESEIQERWSVLRSSLQPMHVQQQAKAGHPVNTLNITAADYATHATVTKYNPYIKDRVEAPFLVASVNFTNPAPLVIPTKEIVHNVLGPRNEKKLPIPTMRPDQKGPLPLRTAEQLRPMDVYCTYNECSTLGNMTKTLGRRIQNMYHGSPPGRLQDRLSASASGALYGATRDLIPHELRRIADLPTIDNSIEFFQEFMDSITPDSDRPITRTATRITRTAVWDNLDLIGPQPDRRMANALAFVNARDMLICGMSRNLLPYCRKPEISPIQGELSKESVMNLTKQQEAASTDKIDLDLDPDQPSLRGFSISGIAKSCELQGGCTSGQLVTPKHFDRTYIGDYFSTTNQISKESELAKKFHHFDEYDDKAVASWPFYMKVNDKNVLMPIRGDARWLSTNRRHGSFDFRVLLLPKYSNLTKVIEQRLPFVYLVDKSRIPVNNNSDVGATDDFKYDALNPVNWWKPWLDWRFAFPAKTEQQCIGPYEWDTKLCTSPVAVVLKPEY